MKAKAKNRPRKPRVADEITAGMHELIQMMDEGKKPQNKFIVKTINFPNPNQKPPLPG